MRGNLTKFIVPVIGILTLIFFVACKKHGSLSSFHAAWPESVERIWLGPDYWANRLQDWQIANGRIECLVTDVNRNVNLLTCELIEGTGGFSVSATLGLIESSIPASSKNWMGFRLGAKGQFNDYRDSAIYGEGLHVGITSAGDLFIGESKAEVDKALVRSYLKTGILLRLDAISENEGYLLKLYALDPKSQEILSTFEGKISSEELVGSMALVSHFPDMPGDREVRSCWFDDWKVSGEKVVFHPDRAWGPILFSQYTLSRGILKITAQLAPISGFDGEKVYLQIQKDHTWNTVGESLIDPLARTATITVDDWDNTGDTSYRLSYSYLSDSGEITQAFHEGVFRKEPLEKDEITVASLSCMSDLGFPHADVLEALEVHDPDLLFFAGDQIYERVGGDYELQREPLDKAVLEYLRKWYLFGWTFDAVLRDRPSISIPDDHDVFQGNLWGAGGIAATPSEDQSAYQRSGGYRMPPDWVKMVERTQTSHLPFPVDPRPVAQGIGVYFTELNYGGVSFAILEDRKFKSGPLQIFPETYQNGVWNRSLDMTPEDYDKPGAILLGERQLRFLDSWAEDWSNQTWMKVALSQTLFSTVSTSSQTDRSGTQTRRVPRPGEYPPDDVMSRSTDTDGWPQTGRNKALKAMRKGFALHLCGDQHLGNTLQYGVDEYGDSSYAFCVPAISNIWPRRWFPREGGKNRKSGAPKYTGDFLDGLHNKITVHAVSNPVYTGKEPADLYDRATGYGILRFNKQTRNITIECWPRFLKPDEPEAKPFDGWPITINQLDNYGREAVAYLPEIKVTGIVDPVIQIIDETTGEAVYTLRINGSSFKPKVFKQGSYTVIVSEPDRHIAKQVSSVLSVDKSASDALQVEF